MQEAMGMAPHVMDAMNMMHTQPHAAVSGSGERKPRPQLDEALKCPRCDSNNTKFCYYNNNKMSQPRYFCKACRRYWTHGGSLRNVPVGGGCRKNKRSSASLLPSSSSNSISEQLQQHVVPDAMIVDQLQDFSNVLPTFMSTSFELPKTHLQPFASFSLPSLAPTPPLDFDDGIMTSSFPDILRGGFPDHQSNSFYEPTSSGMEIPSSVGCDVAMQIDTISIDGDGANATTHQGEQWPTIQVDPINQQEGASVPDTAKDK